MPSPGTRLLKRAENAPRIDRKEFDQVVQTSILETIQMIGDDYLDLFLSLLQRKNGTRSPEAEPMRGSVIVSAVRLMREITAISVFQPCNYNRLHLS
jgi:hypothetical protein